jgi:predicted dehydrogenase
MGHVDFVLLRTGKSTLPDDDFSSYPVETDVQIALERWKPDVALVTNPTALHMQVALPAALAGCHLLLEKPVSHSMDGLDALQAALDSSGRICLVGFQFRFHPGLKQIKTLLENGSIGEVISVHVIWGEYLPGWHPWEDYHQSYSAKRELGGGVLLTLCHPFDYLRWLFGDVSEVWAEVSNSEMLGLEVEDNADVILKFTSGVNAVVHLDYVQRPPQHRLEIVGREGTIRWNNNDGAVMWWSTDSESWLTQTAPEGFERNHLFLDEMRHFLDVIQGNSTPICPLEDGIRALEIVLTAYESSERGCRVSLPKEK